GSATDVTADVRASPAAPGHRAAVRAFASSPSAGSLRELFQERLQGVRGALQRDRALLLAAANLDLELTRLEAAPSGDDSDRAAEQLRLHELLPRARVTVVEQRVDAGLGELPVQPL